MTVPTTASPTSVPAGKGERLSLRRGALPVVAATALSGLSAYGYQIVAARAVRPEQYLFLSALWTLAFLVGPGLFGPVEQELARLLSVRRVLGQPTRPVLRRAVQLGGLIALVALALCAATSSLLLHRLFNGQILLLVSFALSLVGYLFMYLTWGLYAGTGRFHHYGAVTGTEGVGRFVLCGTLAALGVHTAGWYGLAIAAAPFLAVVVGRSVDHQPLLDGPPAPGRPMANAVGQLLLASIFGQVLLSVGPIALTILSDGRRAAAGGFVAAATLTRAPLFLFNAVLIALLPKMSAYAATEQQRRLRRLVSRLVVIIIIAMAVVAAGLGLGGSRLVPFIFGPSYHLAPGLIVALVAASAAFMVGQLIGCGLIALESHRGRTLATAAGCIVFLAVILLGGPLGLLGRVAWGYLAGTAVFALASGLVLRRRLGSGIAEAKSSPGRSDRPIP